MADTIRIKVLRQYRKPAGDGASILVPAGAVLEEDKVLAINLITANKAERASDAASDKVADEHKKAASKKD